MNCFMFPGQPMSLDNLPTDDPVFQDLCRCCRVVSGFNPLDGVQSALHLTESVRMQLFGTAMSLYRTEMLLRQHGLPDMIAEHSMGIYPALSACGSIDSTAAFELTLRIGVTLASMGAVRDYALGSVIGLARDVLETVVTHHDVHIANYNTSRHFLLAGPREKVCAAALEAEAAGAYSVGIFPCDAPLHTPLVGHVADELHSIVAEYSFCEPRITLIDHLEQRRLKAPEIPLFLVEELCRPVYWEKTYRVLRSEGVKNYYEAGAGSALAKFNRWIDSEL
jgi:[acyl-carrier-protein] S-malonyltransferase